VRLFGVFGDAGRLYLLLWRHSLPVAAFAQACVWLADSSVDYVNSDAALIVIGLIAIVLTIAAPMLVQGMLIVLVEDVHEGRKATHLRQLFHRVLRRLPSLFGGAIVYSFGIFFGLLLFVVPGLLALARWSLMAPLIVLEGRDIGEARQGSSGLVKGHTGKVIAIVVLLSLIEAGVPSIVTGAFGGSEIVGFLAAAFVTPYTAHLLSALYFRLREPEAPVVPPHYRRASAWDEEALADARHASEG
jgi:hypothetical protein